MGEEQGRRGERDGRGREGMGREERKEKSGEPMQTVASTRGRAFGRRPAAMDEMAADSPRLAGGEAPLALLAREAMVGAAVGASVRKPVEGSDVS